MEIHGTREKVQECEFEKFPWLRWPVASESIIGFRNMQQIAADRCRVNSDVHE
jgi:hypothetical protein